MSKYTKELLEPIVKRCLSVSDVVRELNIAVAGGNIAYIAKQIKKQNIDTSHFLGRGHNIGTRHKGGYAKKSPEELLVLIESDFRTSTRRLRRAMIESGIHYKCSVKKCSCKDSWLGEKLVLHIDHINGNFKDNRRENLRFLCPNCHSQTKNYCGVKNKNN